MKTAELELYYPASARDEALRVATRLSTCVTMLRRLPISKRARPPLLVYLTSANFNNAFVQPMFFGSPQQMVLPLHETSELFNLTIAPGGELGDIACHEAVHAVQLQQVEGLWRYINLLGGEVLSPNIFTESWFLEGLAVHYEGRLGKEVGRPWNPIWRGLFASGAAEDAGVLNPGHLQPDHGDAAPFGGNYLVGEPFVDYLATRFGDEKLWRVVNAEAYNPLPQFGLALEFKHIYGESLGALFDDFTRMLQAQPAPRARPATQRVLREDLGTFARLASAPNGTLAVVDSPRGRPAELAIYASDGTELYRDALAPILPERPFIVSNPESLSGLCFSADAKRLYFVVADVGIDGDDENVLVELDVATGRALRTWHDLEGMGGQLTPDGGHYIFTQLRGDVANLVSLELATGQRAPLTRATGHQSLGTAAISPSGARIAFPKWMGRGFDLFVLERGVARQVTHDGRFNQSPRFIDEDHVVLLREAQGRAQAFVVELASGAMVQATDAPFVAFDPAPRPGGRLAFVNRQGWSWTLDEVRLPPLPAPGPMPAAAPLLPDGQAASVAIVSDEPYRAADHLLLPTFHLPTLLYDPGSPTRFAVALEAQGSDRLGLHNYFIGADITFPGYATDVALSYVNAQLAPWQLGLGAGRGDDGEGTVDYTVQLSAARSFWTTPLTIELPLIRRNAPGFTATLLGPRISTRYAALDGSIYGGTERGFSLSAAAQVFPAALGNPFDFADLRGALQVYLPQPFPRASLNVSVVGRALPGGPDNFLRVGGIVPGNLTYQSERSGGDGRPRAVLPVGVGFSEALRGYEDHALHGANVVIWGADFHVPLMIEHGWASTLYLFPGLYVQKLDLNAFAREARLDGAGVSFHRDLGAAATLSFRFGQVLAASVFYQYSQRFDDGLGPLHLVGLSF